MPYKPFKLGMYAAERELQILKQVKKEETISCDDIGYFGDIEGFDMTESQIDDTVWDLLQMGLIKFHKNIKSYSLTKKGEKFLQGT